VALLGVWGSSASNVIAVGTGAPGQASAFRFNGTSWASESVGSVAALEGIHGVSGSDVFVVGLAGRHAGLFRDAFIHFDGEAWTASSTGGFASLIDVWAPTGTTAFAVGTGPFVNRGTKK
jgi:hypothetical protein